MIESPVTALISAGVPIQADSLTENDCMRLLKVLGNLRVLVAQGKIAEDFKFEDVFFVVGEVAYTFLKSRTDFAFLITPHVIRETQSYAAINVTFHEDVHIDMIIDFGWDVDPDSLVVKAPLMDRSYLDNLLTQMEEKTQTIL